MVLLYNCRNQLHNRRGVGVLRPLRPVRARSTRREGGSPRPAGSGENLRFPTSRRVISPGVGFCVVLARRSRERDLRVAVKPGPFPLAAPPPPRGFRAALPGHGRSGKSFRRYGLKRAVSRGDSIRRLCTCLTHRHKPPPCARARCLGLLLSRLGSRRVSVRPFSAATPTSMHAIDLSLHSGWPAVAGFRHPTGATRLAGYGKRHSWRRFLLLGFASFEVAVDYEVNPSRPLVK